MDISGTAAVAALAAPSQQARLIQLQGPAPDLVVERFEGQESVCGSSRFEIDCLSTDAFLDMDPWLEQPLPLQLRQADGGLRQWHGLLPEVAQLGSDVGLARHRLTLEPWTALLELRRNAVIFQELDTRTICEQIFGDYPQAVFRFYVQLALPARAIITQYRVSDWGFSPTWPKHSMASPRLPSSASWLERRTSLAVTRAINGGDIAHERRLGATRLAKLTLL